jgi:hypothetical protein
VHCMDWLPCIFPCWHSFSSVYSLKDWQLETAVIHLVLLWVNL